MRKHADLGRRAVELTDEAERVLSPKGGLERRLLNSDGREPGRSTCIVRLSAGHRCDSFRWRVGVELLVLKGTLCDEHGGYPAGTYVRNPPDRRGRSWTKAGCAMFVKAGQFHPKDRERVVVDTRDAEWFPGLVKGLAVLPLHRFGAETTSLVRWAPGTVFPRHDHPGGEEILVLEGALEDDEDCYPSGTWLRNPAGSRHSPFSLDGCLISSRSATCPPCARSRFLRSAGVPHRPTPGLRSRCLQREAAKPGVIENGMGYDRAITTPIVRTIPLKTALRKEFLMPQTYIDQAHDLWQVLLSSVAPLVGTVVVALLVHRLVFLAAGKMADRTTGMVDNAFVRHGRRPARVLFVLLAVMVVLPMVALPEGALVAVKQLLTMGLTAAVGWLAVNFTGVIQDVVAARYDITRPDNLAARQVHTRVRVLRRLLVAAIVTITACLILMSIPSIRQIGITLFASAGIAGLVAGMAARPALSNLIAGVQLALTEPIRLDDVVIVEGEWGWIEEIRPTYVVVRIWDLRRLVVPLSYFIEHPFQNWTRTTADILGTVFLYVDYTVPVDKVREQLHRILESTDLWDGKVWGLQVTNSSEHALELRALMSAPTSGKAWDLRCHVREELITFLQREYPQALPKVRAELRGEPEVPAGPRQLRTADA